MITNLLQQIRDLLNGILGTIPGDNAELIADIITLITNIEATLSRIEEHTADSNENEGLIYEKVSEFKPLLADIFNVLIQSHTKLHRISTGAENQHVKNIEEDVDEIRIAVSQLGTLVSDIKLTLGDISNKLTLNAETMESLNNNAIAIAGNTGGALAFLEDIATNTLNIYDRDVSMARDTTDIIALLTQILAKIGGGGEIPMFIASKTVQNCTLNANSRKNFTAELTDQIAETHEIKAVRIINPVLNTEQQNSKLSIQGFTTTGGGRNLQVALYNASDSTANFALTVNVLVGQKGA